MQSIGMVYGIRDPDTLEVVYVGSTVIDLSRRMATHLSESRHPYYKSPLVQWVRKIRESGKAPLATPLREGIPLASLWDVERFLILAYNRAGARLLNRRLSPRSFRDKESPTLAKSA